jgi:uncharacterized membrane protein YfcA
MTSLPWLVRDGLTLLLAMAAGVLSGAFSMGGQVLMKPGIRVLGASPLDAVGSTVPMILPTVASATITYHRQGLVDWRAVRYAGPAGAVSAIGGSILAVRLPGGGHALQLATAALMFVTGARMWMRARRGAPAGAQRVGPAPSPFFPPAQPVGWAAVGSASGLFSGLLGVGGGVIMVPAYSQLLGMPLITAIATSLVCAGIFAVPATITHALLGTIDWRFAALLIAGAVPGARLGARLAMRASARRLEEAVGLMVTIIAIAYAVGESISFLG